jgi:hypothetical protein
VYIPGNEQEIKNQRFRVLQRIDKNIHDKVDNSVSLLDLLVASVGRDKVTIDAVKKYISEYSSEDFAFDSIVEERNTALPNGKARNKGIDSTSLITRSGEDPMPSIKADYEKKRIDITIRELATVGAPRVFRLSMHYSFDQFIEPLLVNNVFDDYVLLSQKNVIYETLPTGMSYDRSDTLLRIPGNAVSASRIRDQEIAGTQYKMFLQPLMFDKKNDWVLVGLLSNTRYENEKNSFPQRSCYYLLLLHWR